MTGIVPAIHEMAAKVHAVGGRILVDAAQLAGHRPIAMGRHDSAEHLDAIALSAHKMYAPYGSGALITARDCLGAEPDECGGGTVHAVTLDDVVWADLPDRAEAGSPNLLGAVAFAAAIRRLQEIGLDSIAAHEHGLTVYARGQLVALDGVSVLGPAASGLGIIPFTVTGWHHQLIAAVLAHEHGIGVRSGCFCAQPYVHHLLGLNRHDIAGWVDDATRSDFRNSAGVVRISIASYNHRNDIDHAIDAVRQLLADEVHGTYRQEPDGSYHPVEP